MLEVLLFKTVYRITMFGSAISCVCFYNLIKYSKNDPGVLLKEINDKHFVDILCSHSPCVQYVN